ncbi:MAG: tRNA 2-thiouridine(34) synthase MnmA [Deltaproteobacteria bacterium]|nr:MAG: tRNA 2-thiouridine(34) synthase MnmA [Deltaproteobacteria bacterium]
MKQKIAVAISGGIDSLTTAFLLKQEGHDVMGIHFVTGFETEQIDLPDLSGRHLNNPSSQNKIKKIEDQLGIPIAILDCRKEFQEKVVHYFNSAYVMGQTPNPCLICNPQIKFGVLLNYTKSLGAGTLATGHYVKKQPGPDGIFHLFKGDDPQKDQSYFLAFLSQMQLADACFPLGSMHKTTVKKIASENGLRPVKDKESQDICFIHGKSYIDFLHDQNVMLKPGIITDKQGNVLGEHKGLHHFTIGQRRGINCPSSAPYYVIQIEAKNNRIIVGEKQDLYSSGCIVKDINWIIQPSSFPITCCVKIRYQHEPAPATIDTDDAKQLRIHFQTPQLSVTPGQGAVFYQENEVIGGGWITQAL